MNGDARAFIKIVIAGGMVGIGQIGNSGKVGKMIELSLTLDDPLLYTQAFTVKTWFRKYEHLEMGEYFCSEDLWRQNLDGRSENIPWR